MTNIKFKPLEASDIEARVAQCSEKGCSILLYKDARCDMRMLDEAVGPDNWDCRYSEVKGNLFCEVGINTDNGWVYKQDVGIPSNMEAQKGEASDAFKRACFKWGIGRELYTAPFIWVPADKLKSLRRNDKGKWACYDRFSVSGMSVKNGRIMDVAIRNDKTGKVVFDSGAPRGSDTNQPDDSAPPAPSSDAENKRLRTIMKLRGLQKKADELGFQSDFVEITATASYGKCVNDLDQEQLNSIGIKVKEAIEAVERGEA